MKKRDEKYACRADWRDENGKRHRKSFPTEIEARNYERAKLKAVKLAKLAKRIGDKDLRLVLEQYSKIAEDVAMGKKPASATNFGLERRASV